MTFAIPGAAYDRFMGRYSLKLAPLFADFVEPALRNSERSMRYRKPGEIAELLRRTGLHDVEETVLEVSASYQHFDDFWEPIVHGAGSIGTYMAAADAERRSAIREACRARLGNPQQAFELRARACAARGRV